MNIKTNYSTLRNFKNNLPKYLFNSLYTSNYNTLINQKSNSIGGLRTKNIYKSSEINKPLFTIITVCLNSEKTIEETILSVLNQTYDNIEYVIIDGGSSDNTLNIIKKYENSLDLWISEKDDGIYNAINKALKVSSGDIIGTLNSGDIYTKNALALVKKYFKNNINFVFGTVEKKRLLSGFNEKKINWKFNIYPAHSSGFFISRFAQECVGLYDEQFKLHADYDLIFKLVSKHILKGVATSRSDLIGKFNMYGVSSKERPIYYFLEEFRIRKKNKQNIIYISILFIIKNIYFYLSKIKTFNKITRIVKNKINF